VLAADGVGHGKAMVAAVVVAMLAVIRWLRQGDRRAGAGQTVCAGVCRQRSMRCQALEGRRWAVREW